MTERLTTLAAVKEWLDMSSEASDSLLTRVIDAASQFALNHMNRDGFGSRDYTQNFMGNGKTENLLNNWPIIDITSVGINGSLIPASSFGVGGLPTSGYRVSDLRSAPQALQLYGYNFIYRTPCQVIYRAGYQASQVFLLANPDSLASIEVIPTASGQWVSDVGVTLNGVEATKVATSPATGEYSVSEWGVYTFNTADDSAEAIITFSYCPFLVSFGVTELVGEWFKRRDRIGVSSKALSGGVGENVSFTQSDMNASVRSYLQAYKNVIPV